MDEATIQNIINANRHRDGRLYPCRRCATPFRTWGSMWCAACRNWFYCDHQHNILGHIVRRDGSRQGMRWCLTCGKLTAARKSEGIGPFLFHDLRDENDAPPCERCDSGEGVQLHHWAPSAIFGGREANRWPTAWLCPPCHALWHRLMRRASGHRLPPDQRIDDYTDHAAATMQSEDVA